MNAIVSALRFFFTQTLDRPDLARKLVRMRHERELPVVLSRDEVARLLAATMCLKHQAALSVAYGAGLRASEIAALKVRDIDSERMLLRVERGKGRRYRNAMLPTGLLALLREWWRVGRRERVLHIDGWLENALRKKKRGVPVRVEAVATFYRMGVGIFHLIEPHQRRDQPEQSLRRRLALSFRRSGKSLRWVSDNDLHVI